MIRLNVKINPQKSKRSINGVNISSGLTYQKGSVALFEFGKNVGDASIEKKEDNSYNLVIRSFNNNPTANDFIKQIQLNTNQLFLFGRHEHHLAYIFRGEILELDPSLMEVKDQAQQLETQQEEGKVNIELCCLCKDRYSECGLYPCGHVCICSQCKQTFERNYCACPLCKKKFSVCFRLYF
jgi:Zinc finger, C3HC4 type (RING finger)